MNLRRKICILFAVAVLLPLLVYTLFLSGDDKTDSVSDVVKVSDNAPQSTVYLANRTVVISEDADSFDVSSFTNQSLSVRGTMPVVLGIKGGVDHSLLRAEIVECGGEVIGYLPDNAYLVEASPERLSDFKRSESFTGVFEFLPSDKLQRRLADLITANNDAYVRATVIPLSSNDVERVASFIAGHGGKIIEKRFDYGGSLIVNAKGDTISMLAQRGDVRWIERNGPIKLMNDVAVTPEAMNISPVWYNNGLSGKGQIVTIMDTGIDTGDLSNIHPDFKDKILAIKYSNAFSDTSNLGIDHIGHGTHCAGSIVGSGAMSGGLYKGVAYEAKLNLVDCEVDGSGSIYGSFPYDLFIFDNSYIFSGSLGSAENPGSYTHLSRMTDYGIWERPYLLAVFAAGNDKNCTSDSDITDSTMNSPASAKNVLAVGAAINSTGSFHDMAPYSSQGPTADGRIKPDVVAPGYNVCSTRTQVNVSSSLTGVDKYYCSLGGTSQATPLTAGAAALIRQWLVERGGFDKTAPSAALLKAIITGGATDLSLDVNSNVHEAKDPSILQGWGMVNLEDSLFPDGGRAIKLVDYIPFSSGSLYETEVLVTNSAPLDIQLAWIDYPGTEGAEKTLINNLDLEVVSEDGAQVYYGGVGNTVDSVNTIESVTIPTATANTTYKIRVRGKTVAYDNTYGGAAALYIRGAFKSETAEQPGAVRYRVTRASYAVSSSSGSYKISSSDLGYYSKGSVIEVTIPGDTELGSEFYSANNIDYRLGEILMVYQKDGVLVGDSLYSYSTNCEVTVNSDTDLRFRYFDLTDVKTYDTKSIPLWWYNRNLNPIASHYGISVSNTFVSDFDDDGASNYEEYLADTDPLSYRSIFRITSISPNSIEWMGGVESKQIVEVADTPIGPWTTLKENLPPTPKNNSATLKQEGSSKFYRIRAIRD